MDGLAWLNGAGAMVDVEVRKKVVFYKPNFFSIASAPFLLCPLEFRDVFILCFFIYCVPTTTKMAKLPRTRIFFGVTGC